MTPRQRIYSGYIIQVKEGDAPHRYLCWRNGEWDHTGSPRSAAFFCNLQTVDKLLAELRHKFHKTKFIPQPMTETSNHIEGIS